MEFSFECLDNGRWYVILPEYKGPFEDLEMVENSDVMLSALSSDNRFVTLHVDTEEPTDGDFFTLEMEGHDDDGAFYNVINCDRFNGTIWLCNVVHTVFDDHPERLYCSVIE